MSKQFWSLIDQQLAELETAKTLDDVCRILSAERCPSGPDMSTADGFFAGSGSEAAVRDALYKAGWHCAQSEAPYYYVMQAPNGEMLTYVEGDIYRGDTMTPQAAPSILEPVKANLPNQTLLDLQIEHLITPRGRLLARLKYEALQAGRRSELLALEVNDFIEYFGTQAKLVSQALNITLTARHDASGRTVAMCGYPCHLAGQNYAILQGLGFTLRKLTAEQADELAKKKPVARA